MSRNIPAPVPSNRRPADDSVLYRVREPDWSHVWGSNLTFDQARKLREDLSLKKLSRTSSMEPVTVAPPDWWVAQNAKERAPDAADDLSIPEEQPQPVHEESPPTGTRYEVASAMVATTVSADGVVQRIPPNHRLLVNGQDRPVPTPVAKNDMVECRPLHPAAAVAQSAATAAAAAVIQAKRQVPLDVTVKKPAPRTSPPPRDVTMSNQPAVVRLGAPLSAPPRPLPSPLKVATIEDGELLPDDAITDSDLPDLASDLGGGPSDADVEHARRQQQEEAERPKVG